MNKHLRSFVTVSVFVMLILTACNIPAVSGAQEEAPTPVSTATQVQVPPTDVPASTAIPTAAPIQHQDIPGELPPERSSHAGDHDSSVTADKKRAPGGDRFTFGRYERPFNTDPMDVYYPYLDIQDTLFYQDDTWIFAVITLYARDDNQALPGRYAVEIDVNVDGGGDWLILVDNPSSKEWVTEGVQVWFDTDDDVGGKTKVNADLQPDGTGFETLLFDSGQGDDPDLAWARISSEDPNTVEIAAKRSLLGGDDAFLAGMWAGGTILDPAMFDLNDHFTHEQAGAALVELEYFYPIKDISELDNSCRVAIGFVPNGSEPGLCPIAPPPGGNESCPAQYVVCYNFGQQQVCYCLAP